jgi:hypothetical protein
MEKKGELDVHDGKMAVHSSLSSFSGKPKKTSRFVTTRRLALSDRLRSRVRSATLTLLQLCSFPALLARRRPPLPRGRYLTFLAIISSKLDRNEPNRIELN